MVPASAYEMSAYRRLKMKSFSREIARAAVWCPLLRGVHYN